MREIKFRAWDVNTNSFAQLAGIYLDKQTGASAGYIDDLGFVGEVADEKPSIEQWILEQYIGLKDTNDKEIYEGDIVFDTRAKDYNVVKFHKGAWMFNSSNDLVGYFDNELKVVGNIHENPELLEGEVND